MLRHFTSSPTRGAHLCSSLGLLVGKDFLDSLGAVIDFLHNRVKFQLLADDHWVRLHKLKAGHFAVPCLPTPLHQ